MSSTKVTLYLSSDVWTRYSIEADARRVALATHLRHRLEEQDRLITQLTLEAIAEQGPSSAAPPPTAAPPADSGTLVEVLLLLRSIAGPQKSMIAHKEVERCGLQSWK